MDIKVGEYVRDKYGEIHIVYKVEKDTIYCDKPKMENPPFDTYGCRYYDNRTDILKHSFNLIELIEVGDLIEVQEYNGEHKWIMLVREEDIQEIPRYIEDDRLKVISIVTKEQFKSRRYIVGG